MRNDQRKRQRGVRRLRRNKQLVSEEEDSDEGPPVKKDHSNAVIDSIARGLMLGR